MKFSNELLALLDWLRKPSAMQVAFVDMVDEIRIKEGRDVIVGIETP